MALIICPERGGTVSDKATICFHCGYLLHSGATRKSLTLELITKFNILHRVRGGASARCSFLHVMWDACCCFERTRSGSACATSASSCPADSTRAALPKTKGIRGPQISKLRIHACYHRRAWLFDYMGLIGRQQHRKPLRQGSICAWAGAVACVLRVTAATKPYVSLGREYAFVSV